MFQSSEDFNIDEVDFFNDAFEDISEVTERAKRNSSEHQHSPLKKVCGESSNQVVFNFSPTPSTSFAGPKSLENVLNILARKQPPNTFIEPKQRVLLPSNTKPPNRNQKTIQRKFPGPAGLLPEQKQYDISLKELEDPDITIRNKTLDSENVLCSQLPEHVFTEGLWMRMLQDFYCENSKQYLPTKYSISFTKRKVVQNELNNQKSPFMAVVIRSIVDCSSRTPMVLLKDPTGEICGIIEEDMWDKYGEKLRVGTVIALRQVSILTTTKRYYLNITLDNLITIYSAEDLKENENPHGRNLSQNVNQKLEIIRIQPFSSSDFIKTMEYVKNNSIIEKSSDSIQVNNNPFFKTNSAQNIFKVASNNSSKSKSSQNIISDSVINASINNIINRTNVKNNHQMADKEQNYKTGDVSKIQVNNSSFIKTNSTKNIAVEACNNNRIFTPNNTSPNVISSSLNTPIRTSVNKLINRMTFKSYHDMPSKEEQNISNRIMSTNFSPVAPHKENTYSTNNKLLNTTSLLKRNCFKPNEYDTPITSQESNIILPDMNNHKDLRNIFITSTQSDINVDIESELEGVEDSFFEDF